MESTKIRKNLYKPTKLVILSDTCLIYVLKPTYSLKFKHFTHEIIKWALYGVFINISILPLDYLIFKLYLDHY